MIVSGHTHAPALTHFAGPTGHQGAIVNSGCWLRQLQPVSAHFGAPPVFVSRFVQTHVCVYWAGGAIQVELWEHPRPSPSDCGSPSGWQSPAGSRPSPSTMQGRACGRGPPFSTL